MGEVKKHEFKEQIILIVREVELKNATYQIRVVQWTVDDIEGDPVLEKRLIFKKRDQKQLGRHKGFDRDDFNIIIDKQEEIKDALNPRNGPKYYPR